MPEDHRSVLLGMVKLQLKDTLPEPIMREYQRAKYAADRVRVRLSDHDLLWIVMTSGYEIPVPQKNVAQLFRAGAVKAGTGLLCEWRGGKNKPAVLVGVTGSNDVTVRFVGKPEEYNLDPSKVRLAPVEEAVA